MSPLSAFLWPGGYRNGPAHLAPSRAELGTFYGFEKNSGAGAHALGLGQVGFSSFIAASADRHWVPLCRHEVVEYAARTSLSSIVATRREREPGRAEAQGSTTKRTWVSATRSTMLSPARHPGPSRSARVDPAHPRPLGGTADAGDLKSLVSNDVPVQAREGPLSQMRTGARTPRRSQKALPCAHGASPRRHPSAIPS